MSDPSDDTRIGVEAPDDTRSAHGTRRTTGSARTRTKKPRGLSRAVEVGELVYGKGQQTATVRVTYHAYSLASMLEKEIKEVQHWERLSVKNDWVVRPQLAGLVEQVTDLR